MRSPRRWDSLAHLFDRVRLGDLAAFEDLFRAMHARLCEVADSYVQSQAITEEIVQDLFFAIWTKRDRLPNVGSLQAYLFTAVRNRSFHHLRHRAMVRRWTSWAGARSDVAGVAASPGPADEALEADERRARIQEAIDRLPPRARLALVLQSDHEMTQAEIAEAMDISSRPSRSCWLPPDRSCVHCSRRRAKGPGRVFARAAGLSAVSSQPPERRAWRTDDEWARLRERITASDPVAHNAPRFGWRVPIVAAAAAAAPALAPACGDRGG